MMPPLTGGGTLIRATYGAVFADPRRFLDIAWPWLGLSVLAVYGVERLRLTPEDLATGESALGLSLLQFLLSLVNLTAMCGFLCKWTRWLCFQEMPQGTAVLAWGKREMRVLWVTFAVGLIVGLPMAFALLLLFYGAMSPSEQPGIEWAIAVAVLAAGIYGWLRLSLAPVMAALDQPGSTLKAAWLLTRKRSTRLLVLVLAVLIPMFFGQVILSQFLGMLMGVEESMSPGSVAEGAQIFFAVVVGFLMMALVLSAQVLATQAFMQEDASGRQA